MKKVLKFSFLAIAVIILIVVFNPRKGTIVDPKSFTPYEGKSVSFILVDGLEKQRFLQLIKRDRLAGLKDLRDNSLCVRNGIGSFPSMTGFAFYPFLTGMDAVNSGILGLRWLDRSKESGQFRNYVGRSNIHMNPDLDSSITTLFQEFDNSYTCSVNSYMTKGVKDEVKTGWAVTSSKYQDHWIFRLITSIPFLGDQWSYTYLKLESEVQAHAKSQLRFNPPIQWITFAGPDAYAHINGMDEGYDQIVEDLDSLILDLINYSKTLNQERYFVIITDHGLEDVHSNIHMCKEIYDDLNIKLKRGDSTNLIFSSLDEDIETESIDGYFVINGNLLAYVYLKNHNREGWKNKLLKGDLESFQSLNGQSFDLINYYCNKDYIDMVIYQLDDMSVGIRDKNGEAIITKTGKNYTYSPVSYDVFNYHKDSLAASLIGKEVSRSTWLQSTAHTEFPFAVCRTFDLAIQSNAGDLILCSAENVDFAKDYEILVGNYKGGHGGLRSSMLNVEYLITGPKIQNYIIHTATAEDIGATVFSLLDIIPDYPLNGINLLDSTQYKSVDHPY